MMKIEVVNPLTHKVVDIYKVEGLSLLDFHDWKDESEIIICLNTISDKVENLNSIDLETNEPISGEKEVDFYLPDPIINEAISQFEELHTDLEESSDHIQDKFSEPTFMTELKSKSILLAVVHEILQNYQLQSEYKVRISDA